MHLPGMFNLETSWCFVRQFGKIFCWVLAIPGAALFLVLIGIAHQLGWIAQPEAFQFYIR